MLTIVVSGLYTIQPVLEAQTATVLVQGAWNTSFHERYSTDNATAAVVSLIESANLSFPTFTYGDIVIPQFVASSDHQSGRVEATVPVLRAELVCSDVETNTIQVVNTSVTPLFDKGYPVSFDVLLNLTVPLPEGCHFGSKYGSLSYITPETYEVTATLQEKAGNVTYRGSFLDMHVGPWHDQGVETGSGYAQQPDNPAGCPSVLLWWGYFSEDPLESPWTVKSCSQKIEMLNATITVSLSDMSIPGDKPPVLHENTVPQYLSSGPNGETEFWWRLQSSLEASLELFNRTALDPWIQDYDYLGSTPALSNFFRAALFGRTPLPLDNIRAKDQATKDQVFEHVQMFYRRYMAQYISANMRIQSDQADSNPASQTLSATFYPDEGRPRVVQNKTTKIILQAMLAYMFVCASLALVLGKYRRLVIWNPATIMGTMVLFSGSRCVDAQSSSASARASSIGDPDAVSTTNDSHSQAETALLRPESGLKEMKVHESRVVRNDLRLRLGWWSNGVYRRNRPRQLDDSDQQEKWRYGIDSTDLQ